MKEGGRGRENVTRRRGEREQKVMGEGEERQRKKMSHLWKSSPLEEESKVLGVTISMGSSG